MAKPKNKGTKPIKADQLKSERGQPYDINRKIRDRIITLCKQGMTDQEISDEIGICRKTLHNWKASDDSLLLAMHEAKNVADEVVEMSLFRRAVGYSQKGTKFFCHEGCIIKEDYIENFPPDVKAAEVWLRNRQPDRWKEKQEIEHVGNITLESLVASSFKKPEEK